MIKRLNALPPQQLNMLLFALDPPDGLIPPMPSTQGDRTSALLNWAESPSGCGLVVVIDMLEAVINPQ